MPVARRAIACPRMPSLGRLLAGAERLGDLAAIAVTYVPYLPPGGVETCGIHACLQVMLPVSVGDEIPGPPLWRRTTQRWEGGSDAKELRPLVGFRYR
ncbi:hypothetical protein TgHK011_006084 [Trichoderma gracile]|nr:hypothetical protein TgHK011_006084 [Trichoderma gracile]